MYLTLFPMFLDLMYQNLHQQTWKKALFHPLLAVQFHSTQVLTLKRLERILHPIMTKYDVFDLNTHQKHLFLTHYNLETLVVDALIGSADLSSMLDVDSLDLKCVLNNGLVHSF